MGSLERQQKLPISIVDLSLDESSVVSALRQAARDKGFFYLVNHGVPEDLQRNLYVQMKKYFDLPLEEKLKTLQDENNRGYTPMEEETLDPAQQKKGDTKEGYYIGREITKDDPRVSSGNLRGPNQWPSPEKLPLWKETMVQYFDEMSRLGHHLLTFIALALSLPRDFFAKPGLFDDATELLRLLHYSPEKSSAEEGVFGSGAHSDYGMLTLLMADGPGLQICKEKDETPQIWEDVPAMEGAYIVNFGDMLERWSNNLFRSTLHRVLNPGKERYSVPFFFEPNFDCVVECLPTCCSPDNPPRYPPISAGQYLINKYKATHAGFEETPPQ